MEILERYLYAIRMRLPKNSREEVIMELRSLLLDNIESKYGDNPTDAQIKESIKAFGSPAKIAAEYGQTKFIIRPEYTELYLMIIKIVALAIFGSLVVAFLVQAVGGQLADTNIAIEILKLFGNSIQGAIAASGTVTLIFFIISQVKEDAEDELEDDWTPSDLPELPKSNEKVSIGESIAGIVFSLLAIVLFNAFPWIIEGFFDTIFSYIPSCFSF